MKIFILLFCVIFSSTLIAVEMSSDEEIISDDSINYDPQEQPQPNCARAGQFCFTHTDCCNNYCDMLAPDPRDRVCAF